MSARVLFTIAVLVVFVAAIAYAAICARAAVAAESTDPGGDVEHDAGHPSTGGRESHAPQLAQAHADIREAA
ncbi:MAG: hypothetical protein QM733_14130 [Ilumatobacteraceae bacterium]